MTKRMGWERRFYYGTAGSTAATQLTCVRDVEYDNGVEYGDITDGGDGSHIPYGDSRPVKISPKITFGLLNKDSDTGLAALLAAARATTPDNQIKALRFIDKSGGTGFDGDCYLKVKLGAPMGGEQVYEFEATPTLDGGRDYTLNS